MDRAVYLPPPDLATLRARYPGAVPDGRLWELHALCGRAFDALTGAGEAWDDAVAAGDAQAADAFRAQYFRLEEIFAVALSALSDAAKGGKPKAPVSERSPRPARRFRREPWA